jgi:hypothetical protein
MKKIVILLAALNFIIIAAKSQVNQELKNDSVRNDSMILKRINALPDVQSDQLKINIIDSILKSNGFQHLQDNQWNYWTFDRMPCIKPEGNYPMNILKPDSTQKFSILIKKL